MCKWQDMKTKRKVTKLIQENKQNGNLIVTRKSQGTTKVYRTKFPFKEFMDT